MNSGILGTLPGAVSAICVFSSAGPGLAADAQLKIGYAGGFTGCPKSVSGAPTDLLPSVRSVPLERV